MHAKVIQFADANGRYLVDRHLGDCRRLSQGRHGLLLERRRWAIVIRYEPTEDFAMKLPAFRPFAALTVGAQTASAQTGASQTMTDRLPTTDAEKMADALRTAPQFITDAATIADYPASKGGEWRLLRHGPADWTCLPGPRSRNGQSMVSGFAAQPQRNKRQVRDPNNTNEGPGGYRDPSRALRAEAQIGGGRDDVHTAYGHGG
jgi:hypothetical protein